MLVEIWNWPLYLEGKGRSKKKAEHSRLVGSSSNKQENLQTRRAFRLQNEQSIMHTILVVYIPHCCLKAASLQWCPLWQWGTEHTFTPLHKDWEEAPITWIQITGPQQSSDLNDLPHYLGPLGSSELAELWWGQHMSDDVGCKLGSLGLGPPVISWCLRLRTCLPATWAVQGTT